MRVQQKFDGMLKIMSSIFLGAMISLVLLNVVLRYAFHSGLPWSEEFARVCFVYVVFLGIVLSVRENTALKVDILTRRLSERPRKIVSALADLICIGVMSLVFSGALALIGLTYDQAMPATQISTAWLYLASALASGTYVLLKVVNLYKTFAGSGGRRTS